MSIYINVSPTRTFLISEYWILIPVGLITEYLILKKIKQYDLRQKELLEIKRKMEQAERIRRIVAYACGITGTAGAVAYIRGGNNYNFVDIGNDLIDVLPLNDCDIPHGVFYVNSRRLKDLMVKNFPKKIRGGKILIITGTAFCHALKWAKHHDIFGKVPIEDVIGLTSYAEAAQATVATLIGVAGGPIWFKFGRIAGILTLLGGFAVSQYNFQKIATSFLPNVGKLSELKSRIRGEEDVVVVNLNIDPGTNKIMMSPPEKPDFECLLPEQSLFNPKCRMNPTDIPEAINSDPTVLDSLKIDVRYDEMVNMKDVLKTPHLDFNDIYDTGQTPKMTSHKVQGKTVNFLDKIADNGPVDSSESWEIEETISQVSNQVERFKTRN